MTNPLPDTNRGTKLHILRFDPPKKKTTHIKLMSFNIQSKTFEPIGISNQLEI